MLLAVLTLGATMLGVTTVAGLLMVYQIRQVTDFGSSAQSVFAADAGAEYALYNYFQLAGQAQIPMDAFANGASAVVTCQDDSYNSVPCTSTSSVDAISEGSAGGTKRAFLATFGSATGTLP